MSEKSKGSENRLIGIIQDAELACSYGNFLKAESLYTNAISLDKHNPVLFGNRSIARVHLQKYEGALEDSQTAVKIDPSYAKGYFRLGVAFQCLERYNPALVAFAKGMSIDPKNFKFLQALIDTALKSPLQVTLEPVLRQLKEMNLERNPFVVTSVIGQDLLSHNDSSSAVEVLECAVTIDTCSLKLKGSVFSALSSALWTLENYERAIHFMKEDLKVSQALADPTGECRAYGNLGAAYFHQNQQEEALACHRKQLHIAQKLQHQQLIASAHSGLGSVYQGKGDHKSALQHHMAAGELYAELHDATMQNRELDKIAQSQLALGDHQGALKSHQERLALCAEGNARNGTKEEAQVYSDVAAVYRKMKKTDEEIACLKKSADLSKRLQDSANEVKALLALGYTARHLGDSSVALSAYERLLEISLETNNKTLESRSCANLGIVYHQIGDFEMALKLQAQCLKLAILTEDTAGQGRAYGNIGNAYSASGLYEQAVIHHLKELEISHSIEDKESECSTHGNLAVAYQALQVHEKALHHYKSQYDLAKEIGSTTNEARALMNLGNFYNTLSQYCQAIEFYKKYLELVARFPDKSGEGRALYNLGFACFSLHDFQEAMSCYERSVAVATECQDKVAMARAYCNLGLAKKALGDYDSAFDCQNMFLSLSTELKSARGTFKAFGNLGDIYTAKKESEQAVGFYQQQLTLSEQHKDPVLLAQACSSLGGALRSLGQLEQAVELHAKETDVYANVKKDPKNEYKAQGRYGATLTALGRYSEAVHCYERQLELSKSNKDPLTEAQAWGNLAITYNNLQAFSLAKTAFESQIELLEGLFTKSTRLEKCRAYCNVGDCCEALALHREAISYNQMSLTLSTELKNLSLVQRSCKGLSNSLQQLGKTKSAISYCEQRLTACERMDNQNLIAAAYSELGYLYSFVEKFDDAIYCLNQQMRIAVELNDENMKSDAACGLGSVYLLMKDYDKALIFHKLDLEVAQRDNNRPCQGRAYGNIAATYEEMGNYAAAIPNQEQFLFIAKEQNDEEAKLTALHGIGRNSLRLPSDNYSRSVLLLQQAMLLCHGVVKNQEMVMTVFDLGVAMWACEDLQTATVHLAKAVEMAETICVDSFASSSTTDDESAASSVLDNHKTLTKCYSALICILCESGHHHVALDVAEKSRSFSERLCGMKAGKEMQKHVTVEEMTEYATSQSCAVIYHTVTGGCLFQWFISPDGELTYVGCTALLNTADENNNDNDSEDVLSVILHDLQNTLGVVSGDLYSDNTQDTHHAHHEKCEDDEPALALQMLQSQAAFHYSQEHIRTGNGCLLPCAQYPHNLSRFKDKQPFYALYELLISKTEKLLKSCTKQTFLPKLVLIVEGDLLLVPFCMLKKRPNDHFLGQNFVINIAPSFHHITEHSRSLTTTQLNYGRCVVFGNPDLSDSLPSCGPSQAADHEASMTGHIFRVEPLLGSDTTKQVVMSTLGSSEVAHFACHMSWNTSIGVVIGDREASSASPSRNDDMSPKNEPVSPSADIINVENITKHVLTGTDISALDLSATKLVVLGAPYLHPVGSHSVNISRLSSSVSCFVKSLLAAGAKSVLFSMWPVPETASKLLLQTFYSHLLDGRSSTAALAVAMETLRSSQKFEHPSFWAGFTLIGHDVQLDRRDLSMNHALCEVVQGQSPFVREALKLTTHLIEKSAQKDTSPDDAPMYTSQESVSERLNNVRGWRKLFAAAGFELRSTLNGIPDAIFFPQPGSESTVQSVAKNLNLLLGLDEEALSSMGKLVASPRTAKSLSAWIEDLLLKDVDGNVGVALAGGKRKQFVIGRKLWQTDGSSQLLSSLGLLVSHMTDAEVTLYSLSVIKDGRAKNVVDSLNVLFGHVASVDSVLSDGHNDHFLSPDASSQSQHLHTDAMPPKVEANRGIPHGVLSWGNFEPRVDFDASFRSIGSESSANQSEALESANREDFGILPLEEPKVFTQTPKTTGLIAPKPIMLQKTNLQSPGSGTSSPSGGFSPSKKFQFATSLGNMLQSKSPSLLKKDDGSPKKSAWSPLTVPSPIQSPKTPSKTMEANFIRQSYNSDTKVCVVNPHREVSTSETPLESNAPDKFMSVFESMLSKNSSGSSRKSSLSKSLEIDEKVSPSRNSSNNLIAEDTKSSMEDHHESMESPSSGSYKPSPSAASSLRAISPQHEYTLIADKLTPGNLPKHNNLSDKTNPKDGTILSKTSSTHTAFRLINPNQGEPFSKPKLQKYKVETQISTISTLLSENNDLPPAQISPGKANLVQNHARGDADKSSAKPSTSSSRSSNIFQRLGRLSLDSVDDRVQFV